MTALRVEPGFFGPEDRPLAGWLHRPQSASPAALGVVVCNPFGVELLNSHRSLRHFAVAAAERGFPALRFDYYGTGDSAGSSPDPGQVGAWIRSVGYAIDALKAVTGVEHVCLLGLRLGVTLAVAAARQFGEVAAFVGLAPVVSAKSYLREIRVMSLAGTKKTTPQWAVVEPGMEEAGGFDLSAETRADLADLDLLEWEGTPAKRVLLIDRDDMRSNARLADHFQKNGARVDRFAVPGYAKMMVDPHFSVVPDAIIRTTMAWLESDCAPILPRRARRENPTDAPGFRPTACLRLGADACVHESMEFLDSRRILFGIASRRGGNGHLSARPGRAVLLLNSGANHHIGPGRLYVNVARQLAACGDLVVRLDLSGIGESLPRDGEPENVVYSDRANEDVAAAVDYVRARFGDVECIAVGICSGAYHSFKAAVAGVPLDAFVAINPLTFFWKEGMPLDEGAFRLIAEARRLQSTAFSTTGLVKVLRGKTNLVSVINVAFQRVLALASSVLRDAARRLNMRLDDDLAAELRAVAERRVRMCFVFSSDDPGRPLLYEQGGSTVSRLARRQALRIELVDGADHTFTQGWAKRRLVELLANGLLRPSGGAGR
jgi:pimeloyl-ACP methyl ester carboxylesterase